MKKPKFTEAQIAVALKQAESSTRVDETCRKVRHQPGHVLRRVASPVGCLAQEVRRARGG